MINIAIIGDVHLHFNEADVTFFNRSDYDLILFVGDLSNYRPRAGLPIAQLIAQIDKPVIFVPGNHDTTNIWQLAAEIWQKPWLARVGSWRQEIRVQALRNALGTAVFAGYTTHYFSSNGGDFDIVVGRPYSMGGRYLSFKPYLERRYSICKLEESAIRIKQCVDQTQSDCLIFLAHNGPTGLSQAPTDIWGRDFNPVGGDFGDPDLEQAIAYAKTQGNQALAVIAGHLHHRTKNGEKRQWFVEREGTKYVNAARVPRIFEFEGKTVHHHIRLTLDGMAVTVDEVLI